MRPSPQRHTLAVLRTVIGLTQKEMAELAECSRPTIQAVELGKLKLSADLAQRIQLRTGILFEWLLDNNVDAPPVADGMTPYTKATFEKRQAALFTPARTGEIACGELLEIWTLFAQHVRLLSILYAEAYRKGKHGIVAYKTVMAILEIAKTRLKAQDFVANRYLGNVERELSPKWLNEVAASVDEFAAETYEELRKKLKQRKETLPADVHKFLRALDKCVYSSKKR